MAIPAALIPILQQAGGAAAGYLADKGLRALFDGNTSQPKSGMQPGQQNARSGLSQFALGTPGRFEQVPRYNQNQERAFNQLLSQGLSGLGQMQPIGQQDYTAGFAPIEQQARQQFQSQTVPSLAERFTAGAGGALSSPSFASQLGAAGGQLESDLAAQRAMYGMQSRNQALQERGQQMSELFKLLGIGLTPQFDTYQIPGQTGALERGIGPALTGFKEFLPLLGRLYGEYNKANLGEDERLDPWSQALLALTGGINSQGV